VHFGTSLPQAATKILFSASTLLPQAVAEARSRRSDSFMRGRARDAGLKAGATRAHPDSLNAQKLDSLMRRKLILLVDVSPRLVDLYAPQRGPPGVFV
jgi:hypothetical protein